MFQRKGGWSDESKPVSDSERTGPDFSAVTTMVPAQIKAIAATANTGMNPLRKILGRVIYSLLKIPMRDRAI